jgi:hypothetical protein
MAVYAPGTDYDTAMNSIAYLRQCTIPAVNERVTFHLVLDERHFPRAIRKLHPSQGSILVPEGHGTTGGQSTGPTSTTADANHKRTVQVGSICSSHSFTWRNRFDRTTNQKVFSQTSSPHNGGVVRRAN